MASILVCAVPTPGHVGPMRIVARHLQARGHVVTLLTGALFREDVERDGCRFIALDEAADFDYRDPSVTVEGALGDCPETTEYNALPVGDEQMAFALEHVFAASIPVTSAQLRALIDIHSIQAVVYDSLFTGILPLLRRHSRPAMIMIGVTPLALSTNDAMFFGPRIPPAVLPPALRALELRTETESASLQRIHAAFNAAMLRSGAAPLDRSFTDHMILDADACVQLSTPGFEYQRIDLPGHVTLAGPLPFPTSEPDEVQALWDSDDSRPLVIVSQGTLANKDLQQLIGPTLRALEHLPLRVLATTGGREYGGLRVPRNARVRPFIPFAHWLPGAAVVVTNGGYGTVQYALAAGVPLVVAGEGEDKSEVGTRTVMAGCGINLGTSTPATGDIQRAVTSVLSCPGYRDRAVAIAAQGRRLDALECVSRQLARLMAARGGSAA